MIVGDPNIYGGGSGQGSISIGSNNTFIVTDSGSHFKTYGQFGAGSGNTFSVLNGGVFTGDLLLGSSNTVLVSDSGTSVDMGLGGISGDSFNNLIVSNGASLSCDGIIFDGVNNTLTFDGTQTRCFATNIQFLGMIFTNADYLAGYGFGGKLTIKNGAQVTAGQVVAMGNPGAQITITDPGSSLKVDELAWGYLGIGFNNTDTNALMLVTNGASVEAQVDCIMDGQNGLFMVAGSNSSFSCPTNRIYVGGPFASTNALVIGSGGSVVADGVSVGSTDTRTGLGNSMTVLGNLYLTNIAGSGTLQIYGAQATCNGGFIVADQLICGFLNGVPGILTANSGTLKFKSAMVTNGLPLVIGDGTNTANYVMQGGTHSFASGVVISSNSVLSGCGTVTGSVTNYGTILLGGCDMTFSNSVVNFGTIIATNGLPHFLSTISNQGVFVINPPAFQTTTQSNGAFNFAWSAVEGVNYQVEYSTNLTSTNWFDLGDPVLATNSTMTILDSLTNSQRFYRIRSN